MEPWMATVIGVELDETVEQTAQVTLTSLCETRLADTAAMPITLFPIRNQEDPVWKQRLEAVSNPEGPHFHVGMVALAGYVQHMFNLQASTVMRQHLHSSSLEQHIEEMRRANAILGSGWQRFTCVVLSGYFSCKVAIDSNLHDTLGYG
jgi:hypothetical protein